MPRRGCVLTSLLAVAGLFGPPGCAPPSPVRSVSALGAANVLLLDLDGGGVSAGASDDAVTSVSALGSAIGYPGYVTSVGAPTVAAALATAVLVDRVRGYYLPFDLAIVTERPTSGDYAAIFVGGRADALAPAPPSGIAGLASLDCGDANSRSLGFAFSDSLAPQFGGMPALAAAIAHEAGHGYGLQHVGERRDPMYSVALPQQTLTDLFSLSFQTGAYSPFVAGGGAPQPEACGHASPIDNHALLLAALGARSSPLSVPPALSIDFPPEQPVLPPILPVELSATDDIGVVRVEIYRDLELIRVLDTPPYRTVLELPVAASTTLTIEAVDGEAQRARRTRSFAVEAMAPPACDEATPCAVPARCVERFCQPAAPPPADAGDSDAGPMLEPGSDCSMARRGRIAGSTLWWLVLAVATAVLRRRVRSGDERGQLDRDPRL